MTPGFHVDAVLIDKNGKQSIKQPFPFTVRSTDPHEIQNVIDYWRNYLTRNGDPRKLVVNAVYRIEKVSDGFYINPT